ncbi:hypothetical protein [Deinococcus marmoris]|uniref:hypothetical protein n=1 Tax=Deinococcus marmoris TaxID=249408 RepID=UPI0012DEE24C|nr:hypothetical protein [Deinococcus marmoris]
MLLALFVVSACDRTPALQDIVPSPMGGQWMTGTLAVDNTESPGAASDVFVGRTLTLEVGIRGWNENLASTASFGFDTQPVSRTIVDAKHRYSLALPAQVPATFLAPVTGFWTTTSVINGICTGQIAQYSDPAMKLGMGTLRVRPSGSLVRTVDVALLTDWRSQVPIIDVVTQGLVYADRAGSVNVQYDCRVEYAPTEGFYFRTKSDTKLSLQAGWNVLVRHGVEDGNTDPKGGMYTYELRSRPVAATGEALAYQMDSVFFDAH